MNPIQTQGSDFNYSSSVMDLYDTNKRGAVPPTYSEAENRYRNEILWGLQLAYNVREQPQMELNDRTYSMYYLINRQQDMAYNPPKLNPTDSRIVTGVTHEKDNTIEQIISDMNLNPKLCAFDEDDRMVVDFVELGTAMLKKSLDKEKFDSKIGDYSRINISQGNVFILEERKRRSSVKKVCLNPQAPVFKQKWTTVMEEHDSYCHSVALPNTAVFLPNLLEPDIHKQPRIWIVMHIPRSDAERVYGNFPRWQSVPLYPTNTVPPNTNGLWGDFYLQQPQKDYVEIIITESEVMNDYNVLINSVLMYPVQYENGKISGYPLTKESPSGKYNVVMGTNEKIPFYAYGRSVPSKNEVKEEVANEFLRIAVHKFRYSAFPSIGNNSDKVLPASIWNPAEIIPDLDSKNLSILNPNGMLTQSDFSFYDMIMKSIDDTSVSQALDAQAGGAQTATQYKDQVKQSLRKLGITIDGTTDFLREFYWLRLWNLVEHLDEKNEEYDHDEQKFMDAYQKLVASSSGPSGSTVTEYHFQDDLSKVDPNQMFKDFMHGGQKKKHVYVNPKEAKDTFKRIKDKFYIQVVSEPEGQNQSLLGVLFNLLTSYANLRGGPIPNLNYDYIDKIIGQNSGFDIDKIFLPSKPAPQQAQPLSANAQSQAMMPQDGQQDQGGQAIPNMPNLPGMLTPAKPAQNATLAGSA